MVKGKFGKISKSSYEQKKPYEHGRSFYFQKQLLIGVLYHGNSEKYCKTGKHLRKEPRNYAKKKSLSLLQMSLLYFFANTRNGFCKIFQCPFFKSIKLGKERSLLSAIRKIFNHSKMVKATITELYHF